MWLLFYLASSRFWKRNPIFHHLLLVLPPEEHVHLLPHFVEVQGYVRAADRASRILFAILPLIPVSHQRILVQ